MEGITVQACPIENARSEEYLSTLQASPGRVSRGQQQAIPRSQSHLSAKEVRETSGKEGKPDPLNLQSVGTEHLDRFLASVEKVRVCLTWTRVSSSDYR